jgi:spore coat protein SA
MIKFFNASSSVVFYHHGTSLHSKQSESQWQLLLKNTVAIFGVNQAAATYANNHFSIKIPDNHYFKIGNGVEKVEIPFKEKSSQKLFQILFSGRICQEKGVLELIKAYKLLKDKNYNVSLIIAGPAGINRGKSDAENYLEICQKFVSNNNLAVRFTGNLSKVELYEFYKTSNVVVLPTNPSLSLEGMPLCLLEAMSVGIPLIATNVGGVPEIIEHESNGFLIFSKENYYEEIAKNIEIIYLNREIEEKMIVNATLKYQSNFTSKKMIENFVKSLKQINFYE